MATFTNAQSGKFTGPCAGDTRDLVIGDNRLGPYLQAKMSSMLGKKPDEVMLGTPLTIPTKYNNSEGVITSMTQETGFVKGLRIDLQKAQVVGANTYATFQVQWGTGMDGKKGGAYCGALMRVNTQFSVGDLREALRRSLESQTYWRIDP
jgi:hypothetical protein